MILSNTNIEIPKSRFGSRLHFSNQTVLDSNKKHAWLFDNSVKLHTPFCAIYTTVPILSEWCEPNHIWSVVCIYIYMYTCKYMYIYIYIDTYMHTCIHTCTNTYMCIYIYSTIELDDDPRWRTHFSDGLMNHWFVPNDYNPRAFLWDGAGLPSSSAYPWWLRADRRPVDLCHWVHRTCSHQAGGKWELKMGVSENGGMPPNCYVLMENDDEAEGTFFKTNPAIAFFFAGYLRIAIYSWGAREESNILWWRRVKGSPPCQVRWLARDGCDRWYSAREPLAVHLGFCEFDHLADLTTSAGFK